MVARLQWARDMHLARVYKRLQLDGIQEHGIDRRVRSLPCKRDSCASKLKVILICSKYDPATWWHEALSFNSSLKRMVRTQAFCASNNSRFGESNIWHIANRESDQLVTFETIVRRIAVDLRKCGCGLETHVPALINVGRIMYEQQQQKYDEEQSEGGEGGNSGDTVEER